MDGLVDREDLARIRHGSCHRRSRDHERAHENRAAGGRTLAALEIAVRGTRAELVADEPSDGNIQVKTLGLCSSIGLGLALSLPKRKVFVFDGDGALWMNLGSLATIGLHQPKNLIHICWDNQQYESSGGEPTASTASAVTATPSRPSLTKRFWPTSTRTGANFTWQPSVS